MIVDDSLGICAELDAAMAAHVDDYEDEWAATLDDPEKLRPLRLVRQRARTRPTRRIAFVTERGQPVPAVAGRARSLAPVR